MEAEWKLNFIFLDLERRFVPRAWFDITKQELNKYEKYN